MTSAAQFHYWFLCGLFVSYQSILFPAPFSHLSNWPGRKYLHFKMKFTQRHHMDSGFWTLHSGFWILA